MENIMGQVESVFHCILWIKVPQTILARVQTPQKETNTPLSLDNSSLNKCPKPSWQAFRPPHPPRLGNARIDPATFSVGLPLNVEIRF